MKKLFGLICSVVMAFCCFGLTGCGEDSNTIYVYTNAGFPPYEYTDDNNKPIGADIDIMREVCEVLGYKMEVKDVAFGVIIEEVKSNQMAVGAAGITITSERLESVDFSIPYTTSQQYAVVRKGTFGTEDLVGGKLPLAKLMNKKVGTQEATTGDYIMSDEISGTEDEDTGDHIPGIFEGSQTTNTTYSNALVAKLDLIGSNPAIDAIVIDEMPAKIIADSEETLECYSLDTEPESYAICVQKGNTELLTKINTVLQQLIDNGVVDYFILKHSGAIL